MEPSKKIQPVIRIITLAVLFLLGAAIYLASPETCRTLVSLILHGNAKEFIEYLRSLGTGALWVSLLLLIVINASGVLPNIFILTANGVIFGMATGTAVSWLGECIGSALGFFLLRYLLRDFAERYFVSDSSRHYLEKLSGKQGFKIMLAARAIPYMPAGLITALGALSHMRFRDFLAATAIGKLPSVWLEVTLGHDVADYHQHLGRLALLIVISVLSYLAVSYFQRSHKEPD